ncbi:MAG: anthranilate synthase component I [Nitrosopumilales archaeon]|uniref:anthranilate synthase n=2 Tax=Nitrososphaerota TaxID=651137 RepID=A0A7K4MCV6_9ARCH|nr:putative chorismate binding enzyme [uncultured marine crenarchaeote HF4000_APKG6C9]NWJ21347.1 anthranilate synthase component I family protein [Marine Group I thaumarchaeote]NWK01960.1 anthranilate synthase component I family protein [Marine Group I thaumarchaeote]PBO83507.1 MAG: anthranilate synthase component I [Nitrosopumilales archaeon]
MDIFGHTCTPRIISLDYTGTQFEIYNKISRNYEYSFLFESLTGPEELSETSIMGFDPEFIVKGYYDKVTIQSRDGSIETIVTNDPLLEIKKLVKKTDIQTYRYLGGAVGIINYDAIRLWEKIPKRHNTTEPIMEFGIYNDGILFDNKQKKSLYFYYEENRVDEIKTSEPIFGDFIIRQFLPPKYGPNLDIKGSEFSKIVEKAKKYIYDGDIFQVVLSRKFPFEGHGDYLKVYRELRSLNPSPYLYHLKMGKKITIGSSPEMLLRVTNDQVETFPIAGTRQISEGVGSDILNEKFRQELISDEKELAEHTMLVDLGRNDIGKVCDYGTVRVNKLMEVKKFSHVQHMVTHVVGKLNKNYDMYDAFKAVFPAGTVSGAPKVRAMEIIDELESESRGPYAGAVGYFSFNGCCDFAIAIRSIFADDNGGFVQAGAGIVFDSIPDDEVHETEYKAGAMIEALTRAGFGGAKK